MFTPLGCKDKGINKFKFVSKTQFFFKLKPVLFSRIDIFFSKKVLNKFLSNFFQYYSFRYYKQRKRLINFE